MRDVSISASSTPGPGSGGLLRHGGGILADSPLLRRGKRLWEQNQKDRNLPLSKWDKIVTGAYLILRDYAQGIFPPSFHDQDQTHLDEINSRFTTPGPTLEEADRGEMIKPFWRSPALGIYLGGFVALVRALDTAQVYPPAKLLELGGGVGWTAEFLAQMGFQVVSTTISPHDAALAQKRVQALRVKEIPTRLEFLVAPMESVGEHVKKHSPFDAVFVFEALHHAFDWRAAVVSSFSCLRPGGWLLLCNEPNILHTAISYRVARLTTTHEVGFGRSELIQQLRDTGFQKLISLGKRPHLLYHPHWLLAQK